MTAACPACAAIAWAAAEGFLALLLLLLVDLTLDDGIIDSVLFWAC